MFAVSQRIGTLLSRLFDRLFDWLLPGSCHYLGGNQVLPAPLDRETEQEVFRRLSAGDPEARRLLIEHKISDEGFSTTYTVENIDSKNIVFCIGGHAGFKSPAGHLHRPQV